ncbi:MAG: PEP-CTERM sorting domain-containing protein [Planctomycetota bacterium]
MKTQLLIAALGTAALATSASGQSVIASQDFEGNSLTVGVTPATVSGFGTTLTGTFFDSGLGTPWTLAAAGGSTGTDGGDLIGIADATLGTGGDAVDSIPGVFNDLSDAAGIHGQFLAVEDSDTEITLTFDTIDATAFTDLTLGFTWAVESDGFEDGDVFDISINGTSVFNVGGDDLETGPFVDAFVGPAALDISTFDNSLLDVVVTIANNSGSEDIGFDSFSISGVPEPAAAGLLGLGALAMIRRRSA